MTSTHATTLGIRLGLAALLVLALSPAVAGAEELTEEQTLEEEQLTTTTTTEFSTSSFSPGTAYLNVYAIPGSASSAGIDLVAQLWDGYTWDNLDGKSVTVELGGASTTATTDTFGKVEVTLPLPSGGGTATASFAGDATYTAASDSRTVTGGATAPLDLFIIMDESGSMGDDQAALRANIDTIITQMRSKVDLQVGVVGFGQGSGHAPVANGLGHFHLPAEDDQATITAALDEFITSGFYEPGFHATTVAMGDNNGIRPSAGVCVMLFGDENSSQDQEATLNDALAALAANNASLFAITGDDPGYKQLASDSGGQWFNIFDFRNDPQPTFDAIVNSCITVVLQRPDLTVSIDDGTDTLGDGESTTYDVTGTNAGISDVTGVELTAVLPANATFVSASGGGTLSGDTVSWPAVDLAAGDSTTQQLTVTVSGAVGDEVVVTAVVSDDGANGPDLVPANNTASDTNTIVNRAPVADAGGPYVVDEGGTIAFDGTGSSDPDGDSLTYSWSFEGDTLTGASPSSAAADDLDSTATLTVTDPHGASGTDTAAVTVNNVAPSVDAGPDWAVDLEDTGLSITAGFSDPGVLDTHSATIDWGDGTVDDATVDQEAATASGSHTYEDDGDYVVTVCVEDDDGGSDCGATTVTIESVEVLPEVIEKEPALAATGLDTLRLLQLATAALLLGGALTVAARRRRELRDDRGA